jgi:hypothetical protein
MPRDSRSSAEIDAGAEVLDYAPVRLCRARDPSAPRIVATRVILAGFFLIVTPVSLVMAIASAGAGHGDYFLAKILFPFTMLSTRWNGVISPLYIFLAVVQMPLYGLYLVLGLWQFGARGACITGLFLAAAHAIAVYLCFNPKLLNFS